jgi:LmbE family N-acetylglucosaminyl deacetylase
MEAMSRTLVAFHAHPDDEALLTAGTMARAAAEGHRVILVIATDGDLGLASEGYRDGVLGQRRLGEAQQSATALGVERVEYLGYADSGLQGDVPPDPPGKVRFVRVSVEEAAEKLAGILAAERADVLLSYDRNGGYGHRDHVQVHQVAAAAAALAGTPRVLEATVPRDTICRAVELAGRVYRFPPEFDHTAFQRAFSPREAITHRIPVARYARAKRAAMRAHASQASADGGADRTLAAFLRIPRPLYDLVFGREWYIDPAAPRGGPLATDVFEGLA